MKRPLSSPGTHRGSHEDIQTQGRISIYVEARRLSGDGHDKFLSSRETIWFHLGFFLKTRDWDK
jgi:hypothetical protein